ncbi:DNA mismatch repair endonuclease MutL [Ligilactobacillus agilis]|uniref:DNA mismatch repair endonuclease MutL n=1 Tax=Ligilactobacillus agilis TaxID=1601 RepID=UPI001867F3BF|nr:DNA mismatch repair endonuclease MutL [Ligilactobacillus agilis]
MGRIHELSDILADQIAAGEVVERPASVVKELVENALDAHSSQIDIYVEEAGLKSIQVIDNGEGISQADVLIAFRRHATSKITDRADLFKVKTLGFRGEALPSIASVSHVSLETSTQAESAGSLVEIKGGELIKQQPSSARNGTKITVTDLFFNTPARLKYLSSRATELANISDIVNRLALSHTDVAFSLVSDGKTIFKTAGNGNLKQAVSAIYGLTSARQMIEFSGADADFAVSGLISLPKLTRAARSYISLLINGRYIKNFRISKAVVAGYGSKLMVGRYPLAVVNIKLDPLLVDVNVHPTKQEVRISKEEQLEFLLTKAVSQALSQENLIPNGLENLAGKKAKQQLDFKQLEIGLNETKGAYQFKNQTPALPKKPVLNKEVTQALLGQGQEKSSPQAAVKPPALIITDKAQLKQAAVKNWDERYQQPTTPPKDLQPEEAEVAPTEEATAVDEEASPAEAVRFPNLVYIGQFHGTYLLAQSDDGLYIVDQHAAQERRNYEYYRQAIVKVGQAQQELLVPIVLTYPTSESLKLNQHLGDLQALGVKLEDFGQNTYIIRSHPAWFKAGQEEATIREMIDYLLTDQKLTLAQFREKTAIMMSCKRAIKANQHLDDRQAKELLAKLADCENPFNCPHGRPTVVKLSSKDLEHMFKRIQDSHQSKRKEW